MSHPLGYDWRMKKYIEIAFILDRSGSMSACLDAAIEGFNHFLTEQQAVEGLARFSLVLFDDEHQVLAQSLPIQEVTPLNRATYVPRNTTALLDAIGRTVDELGARLAALPENARPARVIVAILTDGLENASVKYTWKSVADRIKHQTEAYQWVFLFLGANQDAIATAAQINVAAANAATYHFDTIGAKSSHRSTSRKVRALRSMSFGMATPEETIDAAAPMSHLVEEEDRKERGNGEPL